jgi:Protein of unknown function (DUF2796)
MGNAVAALALAGALLCGAAAAAPHEHGVGELDAAVDGNTLVIELRLPAEDLVGFERAPRTEAERARIEQVRKALGDAKLFTPNAEARCLSAGAAEVEVPAFGAKDAHADFSATHRFACTNTTALNAVDVGVFAAFTKVRRLKAQVAGPRGQKQATLTPQRARLPL